MNVVAYNIIRPLHATTLFQPNYPTKTILIDLCAFDMDLVDTYIHHWGLDEYSPMAVSGAASTAFTLVHFLYDTRAAALFTRACAVLRFVERDMRGVRVAMQGLLAMARKMGLQIPADAVQYFEGIERRRGEVEDVLIELTMPVQQEVKGLLGGEGMGEGEEGNLGADLAELLENEDALGLE